MLEQSSFFSKTCDPSVILEAMPDALVAVNENGEIVYVNKNAELLFGYERAEMLSQPIELLVPERFRAQHQGQRSDFVAHPRVRLMGEKLNLLGLKKNGTECPVSISLSPLKTDFGLLVFAAVRDITQQKQLQDELQVKNTQLEIKNREIKIANHLKSEFLTNISHELRTPLNSIIGFTELMHNGKTGPIANNQKEYLGYVLTSARHLLRLINEILDLSKVESGKFEFCPEPVVLSTIIHEVCDILHASIIDKQISLTVHVDPAVDNIMIDSAKLKQVLYNFISNAIKFTLDNGKVSIAARPEGNEHFRLEIQDTGIGIRKEDISKLFVVFEQLDVGIAKKYQGSGLGLALNRRIVEAQGGTVGVNSELGKGSTFYAILPRKPIC